MNRRFIWTAAAALAAVAVLVAAVLLLQGPKETAPPSYTPHDSIEIIGDRNFTSANGVVAGTGSSDDPYIIEGWEISGKNVSKGIDVYHTKAHFVIRNVRINHTYPNGVNLLNVTNARVDHAVISYALNGIAVIDSKHVALIGNTISNCTNGINLLSSNNVRTDGNHYADNVRNVVKPSVPWEQSWIGDLVCTAILIPLFIVITAALYFRYFRRPGSGQELQAPLEEGPEQPPEAPPGGGS